MPCVLIEVPLTSAQSFSFDSTEKGVGGTVGQRRKVDLTGCTKERVSAYLFSGASCPSGSQVKVKFSTDDSSWTDVAAVSVTGAGPFVGSWSSLPSGADADVLLRPVGVASTDGGSATVTAVLEVI